MAADVNRPAPDPKIKRLQAECKRLREESARLAEQARVLSEKINPLGDPSATKKERSPTRGT